jgi:SAM-dependent methyltransferase
VEGRRARVLSRLLSRLIPSNASVLDVGCGDGRISRSIQDTRPDTALRGVEVLVRDPTWIPVDPFDGDSLPDPDGSVDAVLLVDVLHHTRDPMVLLREAVRVARQCVIIKDHTCDGFLARQTLAFMDNVGNRRHVVTLPYTYWRRQQWQDAFQALPVEVDRWHQRLGLYWWPAAIVFERSLHFVARLRRMADVP